MAPQSDFVLVALIIISVT